MRFLRFLSAAILAFQVYLPWSVPHYVTQDGSSHVYTAFVTKDLLFHRHTSPYHDIYRVQKTALPNWTGTLILAAFLGVFGPDHAEAFVTTVCLLAGYFSVVYCAGALTADRHWPLLLGNWLAPCWFLWAGFYNFYLGMALMMALAGYFIRRKDRFDGRRALVVAAGMLLIFFTHLIPAILTGFALFAIAAWERSGWGTLAKLSAAIAPTALLVLFYAAGFHQSLPLDNNVREAFLSFPQKTWAYELGWAGEQRFLWPVALGLIGIALVCLRSAEWRSAQGGVAAVTAVLFALYLLLPDHGFGGSVVKMRLAWGVFLFGGLLPFAAERLRRFQVAISLFVAGLVVAQLAVMARQVRATSDAAQIYLAAMEQLPEGARFVRAQYAAPETKRRFETDRLLFDPLLHLDALGAVRRHAVDLSDYQSATGTFSVAFKPAVGRDYGSSLAALESPEAGTLAGLDWVRKNIPVSIDYLILFGEEPPEEVTSRGTLMGSAPEGSFVRVYRLNTLVAKAGEVTASPRRERGTSSRLR